jgi:hypothetical protein
MNCKPGDLAFYVGEDVSQHGRVVRCIEIHPFSEVMGDPCWVTDPSLPVEGGFLSLAVIDCALRPIRDPGDDAQDETLQWLPVPSQHKEVA